MSTTDPERSTVYLDRELRQALREDEEDLAAVRSRAKEPALSDEAFLARLKADGTL